MTSEERQQYMGSGNKRGQRKGQGMGKGQGGGHALGLQVVAEGVENQQIFLGERIVKNS